MTAQSGVTRELADFVAGSQWRDIPATARREGIRGLLNYVGCALGGCGDEAIGLAIHVLSPSFGPEQAGIIGRSERCDVLNAAFLNAASANVLEYDDTHLPTVMHPAAPVAPGLFALAEARGASGVELLHAFILGVEASCRVGNALMPHHYRRGAHITATCGIFGTAAAAGKLMELDPVRMNWALGHAATQSAGLVESLGSMSKSIGVGNAARNGLTGALFAEAGFTAAESAIEGKYGFAVVASDTVDLGKITSGLGAEWEILANAYKPYPCGVVLFPVIDACLALRKRITVPVDQIAAVAVRGHPLLRERTDRPEVADGRSAKVSLQHSVAVALLKGAAGIAQFTDAAVADPAVQALRDRVTAEDDPSIPVEAAVVEVRLADGSSLTEHVRDGRGTPGRPMSDIELDAKVNECAAFAAPFVDVPALIAAIRDIESMGDAAHIMRMAVPV
ncbi:MAG TPA: MmgE/PrpD family protein [Stellaceae bacterium]|nr:MmgE/PrpD family protein [Stellaceae bacterium]